MTPSPGGSFRLFQAGGITVFLHWSWFVVAAIELFQPPVRYDSRGWNVFEYLTLFAIVLLHEFGHALACRQVGGQANQIVLWPLGGVAYVNPPQRPGAMLWSIAAGPLVNVVLFVVLTTVWVLIGLERFFEPPSDLLILLRSLWAINTGLLVFNLFPIYPLDGGQILRSLLWFILGRAQSLVVATVIGLIGVVLMFALALFAGSMWFGILAAFILINCWQGLRAALMLVKLERLPRHPGFACPLCRAAPQIGGFWVCDRCHTAFDTFRTLATCPNCHTQFAQTRCLNCGQARPLSEWLVATPAVAPPWPPPSGPEEPLTAEVIE